MRNQFDNKNRQLPTKFHSMRRTGKYASNKTIRYCRQCSQQSSACSYPHDLSTNKRNRWILINLLEKFSQSPKPTNKTLVRRNYNFYQYNGYTWAPRKYKTPPKHPTLAGRPDFTYQPYVKFLKVNQELFNIALLDGTSEFLKNSDYLNQLLDIHSSDNAVTLLYFLDGSDHCFSSDWSHAGRHAFGGYFADYCMLCSGTYCPLGPKIRGESTADSRVDQVLFVMTPSKRKGQWGCCSNVSWFRPSKADRHGGKEERSRKKIERREGNRLTKQVIESRNMYI